MFHSSNLPALIRQQCITPEGAYPRFLTAIKRTHTSIYVLKLSSDPPITAVPGHPGERLLPALYCPSDPYAISGALRLTRQFESISAAHTHSTRHAVLISKRLEWWIFTNFTMVRVNPRYRGTRFRVAQHLLGLGRKETVAS
jgi:hypothetical protein